MPDRAAAHLLRGHGERTEVPFAHEGLCARHLFLWTKESSAYDRFAHFSFRTRFQTKNEISETRKLTSPAVSSRGNGTSVALQESRDALLN